MTDLRDLILARVGEDPIKVRLLLRLVLEHTVGVTAEDVLHAIWDLVSDGELLYSASATVRRPAASTNWPRSFPTARLSYGLFY